MARSGPAQARLPRLVRAADFERALRQRSCASTPHFAMHHVSATAPAPAVAIGQPSAEQLSTKLLATSAQPVDDLAGGQLLGAVVPKRHARRAVTRNLVKRQIYAVAERHRATLPDGIWVLRLRAPFERSLFGSAASTALKQATRSELEVLFGAATKAGA